MENEVSLPTATIKQLVQKFLPPTFKSSASGLTPIISELAQGNLYTDFIAIVSEKAYEECIKSGKKTIMPDHIISALNACNFPIDPQEIAVFLESLEKAKAVSFIQTKPKEQIKLRQHGMTDDQLLEEQEKLLASAGQSMMMLPKADENLEEDEENYDD
jgi:down-regulator of transcription 1